MNRNIQSPTKSLSSPSWTSFVTSNNSGFNVIPAANNNGTLNASIINMSGTQQSPLQQQSFTATIHTTATAQNQINSNRYASWFLFFVCLFCWPLSGLCVRLFPYPLFPSISFCLGSVDTWFELSVNEFLFFANFILMIDWEGDSHTCIHTHTHTPE